MVRGANTVNGHQPPIQLSGSSPDDDVGPSVPLENTYDLGHGHPAFLNMYDGGKMDGAGDIPRTPEPDPCPITPQFKFVDNSTGVLDPYLEIATQYGWANYMFQTNQGPSFIATP
jgi:hypothetical protein